MHWAEHKTNQAHTEVKSEAMCGITVTERYRHRPQSGHLESLRVFAQAVAATLSHS